MSNLVSTEQPRVDDPVFRTEINGYAYFPGKDLPNFFGSLFGIEHFYEGRIKQNLMILMNTPCQTSLAKRSSITTALSFILKLNKKRDDLEDNILEINGYSLGGQIGIYAIEILSLLNLIKNSLATEGSEEEFKKYLKTKEFKETSRMFDQDVVAVCKKHFCSKESAISIKDLISLASSLTGKIRLKTVATPVSLDVEKIASSTRFWEMVITHHHLFSPQDITAGIDVGLTSNYVNAPGKMGRCFSFHKNRAIVCVEFSKDAMKSIYDLFNNEHIFMLNIEDLLNYHCYYDDNHNDNGCLNRIIVEKANKTNDSLAFVFIIGGFLNLRNKKVTTVWKNKEDNKIETEECPPSLTFDTNTFVKNMPNTGLGPKQAIPRCIKKTTFTISSAIFAGCSIGIYKLIKKIKSKNKKYETKVALQEETEVLVDNQNNEEISFQLEYDKNNTADKSNDSLIVNEESDQSTLMDTEPVICDFSSLSD